MEGCFESLTVVTSNGGLFWVFDSSYK